MKPGSAKRRKVFVKTGPSAVVANVNVGGDQNLARVGGISKNLLVTGHACIEANFTGGGTSLSGSFAAENRTVFE